MVKSDTNPHIRNGETPLETLIMQALRRFGEFSPDTVDGDTALMFIEFANMVVDEVRQHPYGEDLDVDYYVALSDARPIPDPVMLAGMLYHYAMQQGSEKIQFYMPNYFRTMNQHLWRRIAGNTRLQMQVVDDGTNPANASNVSTNRTTGLTSKKIT